MRTRTRQRVLIETAPATVAKSVERRDRGRRREEESYEENEKVEVYLNDGVEPAYVTAGLAATKNLGNYESVKVTCSITMPCNPKDILKCHKGIAKHCEDLILQELEKAIGPDDQKEEIEEEEEEED